MFRSLRTMPCISLCLLIITSAFAAEQRHPCLMANAAELDTAKAWIKKYPWYSSLFEQHANEIDVFIAHGPIFVSPLKQTYQYQMYTCPKHGVDLTFDVFKPLEHRCSKDSSELYRGGKYDMAWAGMYNRLLANYLVGMGLLYHTTGDVKYAAAGKEILMQFADLYLKYPTENTILGPAHVFFGTLSESFWGVDMAYGYDLLYNYQGFTPADRQALKDKLFYPLARITQLFPESASNRQFWYNNVSAAVGFFYSDQALIDFAMKGKYGFEWQLGSAVPESGFWPEWSGYHFVALRGMIHLAEMARHNGYDLYAMEIGGHTMKQMFDAPFALIKPNYEFPRNKDSGGGSILEYAPYYEVGYAVYRDPKYLALLNLTNLQRGSQLVGETSALGKLPEPVTIFNLVPDFRKESMDIYPSQSVNLQGNGFAVLRHGSGSSRRYLYLDYGILGGEHGHPDRLQMGYYANGRNWIVDPLNESYQVPNLQLWYRQTIAHNTLVVDQTTQTWTNGYGNFFGDVPEFQVASGGTSTAYPGVKMTRTLLQVGNYFIDLYDANAPDQRLYDWPLHGFGSVTLKGVELVQQPVDLFGNRPGIPGYDQLKSIYCGASDSSWSALFSDKGQHLAVHVLGEPGSQVFQALTPPIGGFYKQMVKEQVPMPMIMCRRQTSRTRFASAMEAYEEKPTVQKFGRGRGSDSYTIARTGGKDYIHADIAHSQYWLVKEEKQIPTLAAGFNVKEIRVGDRTLLSSPLTLEKIQCAWNGSVCELITGEQFTQIKVWAPKARSLRLNGASVPVKKVGDFIIVEQSQRLLLRAQAACDSLIFIGKSNPLHIQIWNPTGHDIEGKVTIKLAPDWRQKLQSQLTYWGGIVNLIPTNKGPVERFKSAEHYTSDASWIDGVSSASRTIRAGGKDSLTIVIHVPGDAAPARYPLLLSFANGTVAMPLVVKAPLSAHLSMPNGISERLDIELTNRTPQPLAVSLNLESDPAFQARGDLERQVTLAPLGTSRLSMPITFSGYSADNQRYPIRLHVSHDKFSATLERDFYVSIAHFAPTPPSLDGSWKGWNKSNPALINKATQIGKLLFGNQPWRGDRDLSAAIFVMYDNLWLYVGAQVVDDSMITHWDFPRMSYPWDTDCMEVVLDTRANSAQGFDPPTPGLFRHLSLAEYRETNFAAEAWQGAGAGGPLLPKPNLIPGAETYFRRTQDGYAIIARYPLSSLQSLVAQPGYKIGFDIAINDNDGTNYRKNQHIWAGYNQNQSWWDVGTIGALIFGGKE